MPPGHLKIKLNFQPMEPLTIFALQIGGFLPLCFTSADLLIVDRNIVSSASNILRGGKHPDNKANTWWHSFINDSRYMLNPAFAALEGATQSIPTYQEFREEFQRCCEVLSAAFPRARVVNYDIEAYRGAYALVEEITRGYETEVDFLQVAAPLVAVRNGKHQLKVIEETLLTCAKQVGLGRPTLSFLACLSCLYEGSSKEQLSPGRLVVKPKLQYTEAMAHNAIMDLYALQLLIQGSAKLDPNIALCTSDKGLLKFWSALNVRPGGAVTAEGFNFNLEFSRKMFPNLDETAILGLKQRVEAYEF